VDLVLSPFEIIIANGLGKWQALGMPKKPKAERTAKSAKPKRERLDFSQIAFDPVQ
jgi:uncharacterized protein involved in outer membrane biogenesis